VLLRIRWFMIGAMSSVAGGAYVLVKLRQMRARMTPANVGRASALAAADALALAGRLVEPPRHEQ